MKWPKLLATIGTEPVFSSGVLLAGKVSRSAIHKQLTRWARAGKLVQLRRGLYALAEPYRKVHTNPFLVANRLVRPSYVSLQSALAHHGLIPEAAPTVTSITTRRPGLFTTPVGDFLFKHLAVVRFSGFEGIDLGQGQSAFVASPEKALLDLVYLTPRGDRREFLEELRLQHLERIDPQRLLDFARGSRKLQRAARRILELREAEAYETV